MGYCACGPSAAAGGIWGRLLGARGIVPTIRPADDIREQEEGGAASLGGASIWDVFTRGRDRKLLRGQEKAVLPVLAAPASGMFSHVAVTGSCSAARRRPATRPVHLAVQVVNSAAVFDLGIATPLSLMMVI